jgi:hypothetical protein
MGTGYFRDQMSNTNILELLGTYERNGRTQEYEVNRYVHIQEETVHTMNYKPKGIQDSEDQV